MKKFALESIFSLTNKLLELLYAYLFFFWKTNITDVLYLTLKCVSSQY
jgi:hypothetical protein